MRRLAADVLLASSFVAASQAHGEALNLVVIDEKRDLASALTFCEMAQKWENRADNKALLERGCDGNGSCSHYKTVLDGCSDGQIGKVQKELTTQFLTQPDCHGVRIAQFSFFDDPERWDQMKKPHWTLNIDIFPGYLKHSWRLKPSDPNSSVASSPPEGEGTPAEIVSSVCAIAAQHGAEVAK